MKPNAGHETTDKAPKGSFAKGFLVALPLALLGWAAIYWLITAAIAALSHRLP